MYFGLLLLEHILYFNCLLLFLLGVVIPKRFPPINCLFRHLRYAPHECWVFLEYSQRLHTVIFWHINLFWFICNCPFWKLELVWWLLGVWACSVRSEIVVADEVGGGAHAITQGARVREAILVGILVPAIFEAWVEVDDLPVHSFNCDLFCK